MSPVSSLDAASGEPADADGAGEITTDDPADVDVVEDGMSEAGDDSAGAGAPEKDDADRAGTWVRVCALDRLTPNRGVAALVGGQQVALFRLPDDEVRAIGNRDPFSMAHVMSRGVVGDKAGVPKVASPVYKQSFDLRTGRCLDDPDVAVPSYPVRVDDDGSVFVAVPGDGSL